MATKKKNNKTKKNNTKKKEVKNKKTTNKSKQQSSFNNIYVITFLVILVIALIILVVRSPDEEERDYSFYNGYVFEEHPQLKQFWVTYVRVDEGEQRFEARYHPIDLEEFYFNQEINQYFYLTQLAEGKVSLVLSGDVLKKESGYISLAGYELGRVLRAFFNYDVVVGLSEEFEGLDEYPIITCEDASIDNLVVEFLHGETGIEFSPFCVSVYFDEPEDSLKMSYLMIYHLFGIMG